MEQPVNEGSVQEDVYVNKHGVDEKHGVDLAQHIVNLLKLLGYNYFPALEKINCNKLEELEETVRTVFATD